MSNCMIVFPPYSIYVIMYKIQKVLVSCDFPVTIYKFCLYFILGQYINFPNMVWFNYFISFMGRKETAKGFLLSIVTTGKWGFEPWMSALKIPKCTN